MAPQTATVEPLTDPRSAELVLHPLRARILSRARTPVSAAELGRALGEPRQKINYHVHRLLEAGLLRQAGERRPRGLSEPLYEATAEGFIVTPSVLGPVGPEAGRAADATSAAYLLALTGRAQDELARVLAAARSEGKRVATLSLEATVHFASPGQRASFAAALQEAITQAVEEHAVDRRVPAARPFRLLLGMHPVPREEGT